MSASRKIDVGIGVTLLGLAMFENMLGGNSSATMK